MMADDGHGVTAGLGTVLREWGRIGVTGFGGPPAHIALLRQLCVERRQWLDEQEFEDAIGACNLLPGPASTELAIFCAWRVRGRLGALTGGLAFIVPGLMCILALSVLFLAGTPPLWVKGAGAGAGAAVAAVAVQAGWSLLVPSWTRARRDGAGRRFRWITYLLAGGAAVATIGPWLVTPDELADVRAGEAYALQMTAHVNGLEISHGAWSSAHFSFGEMLARASADAHLQPGDLIGSGTVGTGCLLEMRDEVLKRYLQPGDTVTLAVERLGTLTTPIVERPSSSGSVAPATLQ